MRSSPAVTPGPVGSTGAASPIPRGPSSGCEGACGPSVQTMTEIAVEDVKSFLDACEPDLIAVLIAFRNSATHSNPESRAGIELTIANDIGLCVENKVVFRICCLPPVRDLHTNMFVSACRTLQSARNLLKLRPPNPLADHIYELHVTGKVIPMHYGDRAGDRYRMEDEILIPVRFVIGSRQVRASE